MPTVEYPGSGTGLSGGAYAQWLYNLILWIDRERAATGGVYNVTSNLIQETAAHELNAFLMDDPQVLGEQFYQELLMAIPQASAAAATMGSSILVSNVSRVMGTVRRVYRGMRSDHPLLATYNETGVVMPWGGEATLEDHVNHNETYSEFTSWSLDIAEARRFAGPDGTILTIDLSEIPNQRYYSYEWSWFPSELEVTVQGPVFGAQIVP